MKRKIYSVLTGILAVAAMLWLTALDGCPGGGAGALEPTAGSDKTVEVGQPVTLTGSIPGGTAGLTISWSFQSVASGSALTDSSISGATTMTPSFTPDVAGNYVLDLFVTDGLAEGTASVTVTATATEPAAAGDITVNAGSDQNVSTGSTVTLTGTVTGTLTSPGYAWIFESKAGGTSLGDADITGQTTLNASFVPDVDGTYILKLTVRDGDRVGSDSVTITASPSARLGNFSRMTGW